MPPKKWTDSLFFRWVLDNQAVSVLLISLLTFLTILVFTKISFLFVPILSFLGIIMLPMVISVLLYYLLKPWVNWLEGKLKSRLLAIALVFAIILALLIWAIASLVPMITNQLTAFISNLPLYVQRVDTQATSLLSNKWLANYRTELMAILTSITNSASNYAERFSTDALNWASTVAGTVARVTIAVIMSPFILFYLLRDSGKMKEGFMQVVPTKLRGSISRVLGDINQQLSGYVKGQVTVAVIVGIMFSILFSLVGLRYAVTFGIIAGFLNMIPYLGSFMAFVPVVILALVQGPWMLVKILLVFFIEQTIEGRFVQPIVMGSQLNIHPITIMVILLTAGSMFGVWGVFLGIPVYASIKVIVSEIFNWYKSVSGLYEEGEESSHVE